MFTVRVYGSNGNENLFEANNIHAEEHKDKRGTNSVTLYLADNSEVTVFDGYLYVMNSNGKTVANYTIVE